MIASTKTMRETLGEDARSTHQHHRIPAMITGHGSVMFERPRGERNCGIGVMGWAQEMEPGPSITLEHRDLASPSEQPPYWRFPYLPILTIFRSDVWVGTRHGIIREMGLRAPARDSRCRSSRVSGDSDPHDLGVQQPRLKEEIPDSLAWSATGAMWDRIPDQ